MSKKGRLTLEYKNGKYKTIEEGKGDTSKVIVINIQLDVFIDSC